MDAPVASADNSIRDLAADLWVARDATGKPLPDHESAGPPRPEKHVGIFYFVWHGAHGDAGPYDVSRLVAESPDNPAWGPERAFHHWGEPEMGYYRMTDRYVLRRHASMLSDAGIDVAVIDVTNALAYPKHVQALCETWSALRREGNPTPQIAFLANSSHDKVVRQLYQRIYKPGEFRELWYHWRGKPLMLASTEKLPPEITSFFTFRRSWAWSEAAWFGEGRDKWCWIDHSPQQPGWHEKNAAGEPIPEQISVAVAGHPINNIGRSHARGKQPPRKVAQRCKQGRYFAEQWRRAREVDPPFVLVTGWNEWVAQRFVKQAKKGAVRFLGEPLKPGDTHFIDQYDQEFSRDIEPMRGGHGDAYYKQLVAEVRRFKGVRPREVSNGPHTIDIDGKFDDWQLVTPEFRDAVGDTAHRNHEGWGKGSRYVNHTGRNDFRTLKVAYDDDHIYFYAQTTKPITLPQGEHWMELFIQGDDDPTNGWNGYDYIVRRVPGSEEQFGLFRLAASGPAEAVAEAPLKFAGRQLELAIPRVRVSRSSRIEFDFHWADNMQSFADPNSNGLEEFNRHGDSAPNRSFDYRFIAE